MASDFQTTHTGVKGWIDHRLPVFTFMDHSLNEYPTPKNLSYWWNFGSLAGICLVIMILSGIFLAMNYASSTMLAFDSVERIMRDVNGGWLLRYIHMNGASMFFIVVYLHIFRGLYYGSYKPPREVLWGLGVVILLLMMATAFMGYVLPWGQMSLWGAEVITNFFSAVPVVGDGLTEWIRGGYSVDNATLTRFFALHYLMPFLIVGTVILHLIALHRFGSNNPLGIDLKEKKDKIPFHPYYTIKDLYGLGIFLLVFCFFIFYAPNYLGHPDNYIPANPMQTPAHIVPEWYFLPFYAILRAVDFATPLWPLGLALFAFPFVHNYYLKNRNESFSGLKDLISDAVNIFVSIMFFVLNLLTLGKAFGNKNERLPILAVLLFVLGGLAITAAFFFGNIAIDSKLGGVLAMGGAIVILFFLPILDKHPVRSSRFRPWHKKIFWFFFLVVWVLGFCGAKGTDVSVYYSFKNTIASAGLSGALKFLDYIPMIVVGQLATAYYFAHFLVVLPLLSKYEPRVELPDSIDDPILPENKSGNKKGVAHA